MLWWSSVAVAQDPRADPREAVNTGAYVEARSALTDLVRELEEERALLESEQLNTLQLIEDLSSEYYLEGEARTKHGLGYEGETLIVVQTDDDADSLFDDAADSLHVIPNYKRWFFYFFDREAYDELASL